MLLRTEEPQQETIERKPPGAAEQDGEERSHVEQSVWTTDKVIIAALLSAEITERMGRDPGELYGDLAGEFRNPVADRVQAPATPKQKQRLTALSAHEVTVTELAGEKIDSVINRAPGNNAAIGGIKVSSASGWFAARPSGTEDIYKIYAESFRGADELQRIFKEAQATVDAVHRGAGQCELSRVGSAFLLAGILARRHGRRL